MTLTGFLLARIAEDERMAEGWRGENAAVEFHEHGDVYVMDHQPWVRVLAECEAKRRIVAILVPEYDGVYGEPSYCMGLAEDVLKTLALPYADHPDYDESWRV